jgi:hypothetical protein
VDVNVKEKDTASIDSPDMVVLQSSLARSHTKVTEKSSCLDFYQKIPEVGLAAVESGFIDSCKDEMSVELSDSPLKQPQVSREETVSATQTSVMSSATAQPAKRKVRTVGTKVVSY